MKFDVVISNPPYNNDMYLDFVKAGYDLLKPDGQMVMITPAKWYAKGGKKNEDFRQTIVPHMKEIHVYPNCKDIFDIAEAAGITYYSVYKSQTFDTKLITNHCSATSLDDSSLSKEEREHSEQPLELTTNANLRLMHKCLQRADNKLLIPADATVTRYVSHMSKFDNCHKDYTEDSYYYYKGVNGKLSHAGYVRHSEVQTILNIDKYKVVTGVQANIGAFYMRKTTNMVNTITYPSILCPGEIHNDNFVSLAAFDTIEEADAFRSYVSSKLVGFILSCSMLSNTLYSVDLWRHVPALPAGYSFDHIYTNEEIYKIFELTPDERSLITNIIKDRKSK